MHTMFTDVPVHTCTFEDTPRVHFGFRHNKSWSIILSTPTTSGASTLHSCNERCNHSPLRPSARFLSDHEEDNYCSSSTPVLRQKNASHPQYSASRIKHRHDKINIMFRCVPRRQLHSKHHLSHTPASHQPDFSKLTATSDGVIHSYTQ